MLFVFQSLPAIMKTVIVLVLSALIGLSSAACKPKSCKLPDCRCFDDPSPPGDLKVRTFPFKLYTDDIVDVSFLFV